MNDDNNGRIKYSNWIIELVFMITMVGIMLLIADVIHAAFTL